MERIDPVPCEVFEVKPGVRRFQDDTGASFYLIDGSEAGVVIDTGLSEGKLLPVLRRYTQKPLTLLITHGHGDHMAHADEFDRVYMSPEDIPFLDTALKRLGVGNAPGPERFLPLSDGQKLVFGDVELEVFHTPGHSAGSVVFYDRGRGLMFSGDAFGSGWAVFMQLPGGAPVSRYREGLRRFLSACGRLGAEPEFLPGHFDQRYHDNTDNPVCLELIRDMEALCGRLLEGSAELEAVQMYPRAQSQEYLAKLGRAKMVVSKEAIC